ncbi:MAG: hypothetical protein M5U26_11730 [Planctomycetota bacterium]|nr:hypothetical protein [Planctomycetota bacterium]
MRIWHEAGMGIPRKGIMVRLPRGEAEERFVELCERYKGLTRSAVMRMLLTDVLTRPLEDQVEAIDRQIRGGQTASKKRDIAESRNTNRIRQGRR